MPEIAPWGVYSMGKPDLVIIIIIIIFIIIAHRAFNCLHSIFKNKTLNLKLKLKIFQALIESIFLYNSECWGLNKEQEERINITQTKFLRNILGIRWHKNNWISNDKLYEKTQQQDWSRKIAHRRLRCSKIAK